MSKDKFIIKEDSVEDSESEEKEENEENSSLSLSEGTEVLLLDKDPDKSISFQTIKEKHNYTEGNAKNEITLSIMEDYKRKTQESSHLKSGERSNKSNSAKAYEKSSGKLSPSLKERLKSKELEENKQANHTELNESTELTMFNDISYVESIYETNSNTNVTLTHQSSTQTRSFHNSNLIQIILSPALKGLFQNNTTKFLFTFMQNIYSNDLDFMLLCVCFL